VAFATEVNGARRLVWGAFGNRVARTRLRTNADGIHANQGATMRLRTLPLIGLLLTLPVTALANDDDVSLDAVPPPVKATIQREVKGGQILDLDRDTKQGKVVYEVEFVDAGKNWEIHVAEDGKLLSRRPD
jgi:hypothetical protein